VIEHVHDRAARQPVVEIAKHHVQRVAHGLEILQDLPDLKSPFPDAQAEMGREHVQLRAAGVDRRRQRPAGFPAVHRQIDAMHFHDGRAREQRVAEALRDRLPRRTQGALIGVEHREEDGFARFQRHAGRVGELLQRDDVGVQFADDPHHAIWIVASIPAHAGVHVIGRDPEFQGRRRH
jgi:hypothetical protein